MEVYFSSSSASPKASSKASSSESTASSENCVTVSDTDVSVPPRKKTKLSTKSTIINSFSLRKFHKNTEDYKYYTEMSNV